MGVMLARDALVGVAKRFRDDRQGYTRHGKSGPIGMPQNVKARRLDFGPTAGFRHRPDLVGRSDAAPMLVDENRIAEALPAALPNEER